ncbi:MAG: pyridoxamine 5'-phosphate oxidase family protein [Dehalococcoidia bacterium]
MTRTGAGSWNERVDMSPAEIDDFLTGRWLVRFGTIGRDGYPNVMPMWYYWDGKCFYIPSNHTRVAVKNLQRDPRCFAIVDIDLRPQMGTRVNFAKAVTIKGDASLLDVNEIGRDTVGTYFESGPYRRPMPLGEAVGLLVARYRFQDRDGALGRVTREPPPTLEPSGASAIGPIVIKIVPKLIRAWDFSKAPFDYIPDDDLVRDTDGFTGNQKAAG